MRRHNASCRTLPAVRVRCAGRLGKVPAPEGGDAMGVVRMLGRRRYVVASFRIAYTAWCGAWVGDGKESSMKGTRLKGWALTSLLEAVAWPCPSSRSGRNEAKAKVKVRYGTVRYATTMLCDLSCEKIQLARKELGNALSSQGLRFSLFTRLDGHEGEGVVQAKRAARGTGVAPSRPRIRGCLIPLLRSRGPGSLGVKT
jgi:hypothetical protein